MTKAISVIGGGISGLSCAVLLQEAGFRVSLVTDKPLFETTAAAAGAQWFPFHAGEHPRTLHWAQMTFDWCQRMMGNPDMGISMVESIERYQTEPVVPDIIRALPGFRELTAAELPENISYGYSAPMPFMQSRKLLSYLAKKFATAGGTTTLRKVENLSAETSQADLVVNCTGMGARELCNDDTLVPAKGHVVVVANPGLRDRCVTDYMDAHFTHIFTIDDICIAGGVYQDGNADLTPDPRITDDILKRAAAIEPALKNAQVLSVRTGLRPVRPMIRLEAEKLPGGTIIHNYGHGGSGFTLSHGCAADVVALAKKL
jgi:D-amino-acid oxidase